MMFIINDYSVYNYKNINITNNNDYYNLTIIVYLILFINKRILTYFLLFKFVYKYNTYH